MQYKSSLLAVIATATCLALPTQIRAVPQDDSSSSDNKTMQHHRHHDCHSKEQTTSYQGEQTAPTDINKASSLLGMKVQNEQNQELGKIKDMVFNWDSGQASYAVLEKSEAKSVTGKYVAVPLNALKPSQDKKHLVLNVDKARVENAKGFADNNWPSPASTAYGGQPEINEIFILEAPANPEEGVDQGGIGEDQNEDSGSLDQD